MAIRDALLPEFDQEIAGTRKCLERLPTDKFGYSPHPKSWPMGKLATHVATIVNWAVLGCTSDHYDMAIPDPSHRQLTSAAELVARLDELTVKARAAIAATDDAKMAALWSLKHGDKVVMSMPRSVMLRTFVMSHLIHHRAQLTIYMRMLDVPVPGLYGPSADEQ